MEKQNFYFTFGQSHYTIDGVYMGNRWVRVEADSYSSARILFVEQFSSVKMEKLEKFSFQYYENDFNPIFFTDGEYEVITQILPKSKK